MNFKARSKDLIISYKKIKFLALTAGVSMAVLFAPINNASATEGFTPAQKKEIESIVKQAIADNPELILDSVRRYQEDQERKIAQNATNNLKGYKDFFSKKDLPIAGNPDGDVTVVEFFDFNCGYCKKAFEDVQKIINEDKNVRIVFMDLPILSPSSSKMANIALAAHKQGKYFEMHKALMEYRGSQNEEAFLKLAEKLGLDMKKLKEDMKSADVQSFIAKSKSMAQSLGIRGTPGFIIGDKIYPGYIGMAAMREAVKTARDANSKK